MARPETSSIQSVKTVKGLGSATWSGCDLEGTV